MPGHVDEWIDRGLGWRSIVDDWGSNGWITPAYLMDPPPRYQCALLNKCTGRRVSEAEELLRVNMLFNWLRGDFGPIDEFVITRNNVEDLFDDCFNGYIYPYGGIKKLMVGKELKYWDHILNGDKRKKPLTIRWT